ncbi:tetratricopeptide repeat protein [Thioalkalivibrio sulfidiphilus]|uniref:tetratricopeptide repeat protein n=1 Tax=Thioalkalivibrio sulfidiphilus TaxID=1033854 RepID=UPI00035C741F|nr:tetratricopeptide repeat protein [Thioalkalivibrio sulfidiphilus]
MSPAPATPCHDARRLTARRAIALSCLAGLLLTGTSSAAAQEAPAIRANPDTVRNWNRFVDGVYQLHLQHLRDTEVRTESRPGGYPEGSLGGPDFFHEVHYYDAATGRLLSRIQWEREQVQTIHSIQVYLHDDEGRVRVDYYAAYLPVFRNAPMNTLVNLHAYHGELRAFRQFDASGNRRYEQCRGRLEGESLWLDAEFFPVEETLAESDTYQRCFGTLQEQAGEHIDPLHYLRGTAQWPAIRPDSEAALDQLISQYARKSGITPLRADLRVKGGDARYLKGDDPQAIAHYDAALEIDADLYEAHFGRGMALTRLGRVEEGIEAMDRYLAQAPGSALGYVQRGLAHLALDRQEQAVTDLRRGLTLDPDNAEARAALQRLGQDG